MESLLRSGAAASGGSSPGFSQAAALLALQESLYVDSTGALRRDWFPSFNAATLVKLTSGVWRIGSSSHAAIDLWGELVSRLYTLRNGPLSRDL
eukprot:7351752-Prymnesium_polylepis.1